ncbi:hypothetical protein MMC16_004816 [Acarospora aff. strigata]|nr:hypothetical protein [Acarospora aff. strigata]
MDQTTYKHIIDGLVAINLPPIQEVEDTMERIEKRLKGSTVATITEDIGSLLNNVITARSCADLEVFLLLTRSRQNGCLQQTLMRLEADHGREIITVVNAALEAAKTKLAKDVKVASAVQQKWGTWDILQIPGQKRCSRRTMTLLGKLATLGCHKTTAVTLLNRAIKDRVEDPELRPGVRRDQVLLPKDVEAAVSAYEEAHPNLQKRSRRPQTLWSSKTRRTAADLQQHVNFGRTDRSLDRSPHGSPVDSPINSPHHSPVEFPDESPDEFPEDSTENSMEVFRHAEKSLIDHSQFLIPEDSTEDSIEVFRHAEKSLIDHSRFLSKSPPIMIRGVPTTGTSSLQMPSNPAQNKPNGRILELEGRWRQQWSEFETTLVGLREEYELEKQRLTSALHIVLTDLSTLTEDMEMATSTYITAKEETEKAEQALQQEQERLRILQPLYQAAMTNSDQDTISAADLEMWTFAQGMMVRFEARTADKDRAAEDLNIKMVNLARSELARDEINTAFAAALKEQESLEDQGTRLDAK